MLGKLTDTLKRWQEWDIISLIRNQEVIQKQLLTLFRAASDVSLHAPSVQSLVLLVFQGHGEKHSEYLLKRLLILDSIALSAHLEAIVVNEKSREEVIETKSVGAQSLLNLLHDVCLRVLPSILY